MSALEKFFSKQLFIRLGSLFLMFITGGLTVSMVSPGKSDLKKQLVASKNKHQHDKASLMGQLDQESIRFDQLQDRFDQLQSEYSTKKAAYDSALLQKAEDRDRIDQLQADLSTANRSLLVTREELQQLMIQYDQLERLHKAQKEAFISKINSKEADTVKLSSVVNSQPSPLEKSKSNDSLDSSLRLSPSKRFEVLDVNFSSKLIVLDIGTDQGFSEGQFLSVAYEADPALTLYFSKVFQNYSILYLTDGNFNLSLKKGDSLVLVP